MDEPDPQAAALGRGDALIQLGRWAQAEAALRPVLATEPDHPTALSDLAWVLRNTGRPDEAYELARRLVAVEPDWPVALIGLSDVLCERNEPAEAERYARRAVELDPQGPGSWVTLAGVLSKLGPAHGDEALAAAREAVRLAPEWPRAHSVLSMTEFRHGDIDRAERSITAAIALAPDAVAYHNALGMTQLERGRLDEALATFQGSAALSPDATSISNIFQLLESHGVPEPFVELYTRPRTAIGDPGTIDPTDPRIVSARLHYVDRLWERGARDAAWTLLESIHRDNPELEAASEAHAFYALKGHRR
jgi:predicted Zn-dependent protease